MSMESDLIVLLGSLVNNEVYWDTTPEAYAVPATGVIILQRVGGKAGRYVENDVKPDHKNARVQASFWTTDQLIRGPISRLIEDEMVASVFSAEPIGAAVDVADASLMLFGSQQSFGFWYSDP